MKPILLIIVALPADLLPGIAAHFDTIYAPDAQTRADAAARLADVEIVLTNGSTGYSASEIDATPRLTLISAQGAGYENIDVAYAKSRGIVVSNGAGTNSAIVADHAMALLLGTMRRLPVVDRLTRDGVWRDTLPLDPGLSGKRVGIVGLGRIGEKIGHRLAGFECDIGYHTRTQRPDSSYRYFENVVALAAWSDCLVIAAPGGAATHHMIDATVLRALGANGFLVNVARGSLVDTAALARALADRTIAGAGLDVYESEPAPPAELIGLEQAVLTCHVGGRSPDAVQATIDLFIANAQRHLAGEPVLTPL